MVGSNSYQQESLKKTVMEVVQATRKLPHYFQEHIVVILTQLPLKSTLRSTNYTRSIVKWGTVLGASDIKYMPRTLVKGLVIAGLVAQFAEFQLEKEANNQSMDGKSISTISLQKLLFWKEYIGIF